MQESLSAGRTKELLEKLNLAAAELRKITAETGAVIRITSEKNRHISEEPCSIIYFGLDAQNNAYTLEHMFDGSDQLHFKGVYSIEPEEIRWTRPPERFEKRIKK